MTTTRRSFLKTGATAATIAAITAMPRPLMAKLNGSAPEVLPPVEDPRLKALAARALDVARSAGAAYADIRLTHTWDWNIAPKNFSVSEQMTVGVRALVDGYWGFASGPMWSPDEMARLGREAVFQAKANTLGKPRTVELAPTPTVPDGHWVMPIKLDPFEISPFEIMDYLSGLAEFLIRTPNIMGGANVCHIVKQEKLFASTPGSYCTQRTYRTEGQFSFRLTLPDGKMGDALLDCLSPAGMGWELYRDQPLREAITRTIAELRDDLMLPIKPVDVGRYDTVFDAEGVANLVHQTLGPATELDRALGYEANAGGTSYINAPFDMVGTYQAGAPNLSVTANRSERGGCATVQWDDEGVTPDDFPLVKQGVLTDFQTTRESAGWLKDFYAKSGRRWRSHGCAAASDGIFAPMQHAPNLAMTPGNEALDFNALVSSLSKGIAVKGLGLDMDFQHSSGLATGRIFEVKNGKRVAMLDAPGLLFRSSDLWKGLLSIGGKESLRRFGLAAQKGEPMQELYASVTAPPAMFKQVTLIDVQRKA